MSKIYYESSTHLFNMCKVHLKKKNFNDTFVSLEKIRLICEYLYDFNINSKSQLLKLGLRNPVEILTYMIYSSENLIEFNKNISTIPLVVEQYMDIINTGIIERDKYPFIFENNYAIPESDIFKYKIYNKFLKKHLDYTEEFMDLIRNLMGVHGIYFFYSHDHKLLYIGKSSRNLGGRILSSLKERQNVWNIRYALTKSKSDANLYELYYISKYKPPLNKDCKENDSLNISLDELSLSNAHIIFKEEI